jgi:formylmethanofuran dehydrogenase subunit E
VTEEITVKCSLCKEPTPESEAIEIGSRWVCGMCYDDL